VGSRLQPHGDNLIVGHAAAIVLNTYASLGQVGRVFDGHANVGRVGVISILGELKHRDPGIPDQLIAQQQKRAGPGSEGMGGGLAHDHALLFDQERGSGA